MAGTRQNSAVGWDTDLTFILSKDGTPFDALAVTKVEIYDSYEAAVSSDPTGLVETISATGAISRTAVGTYAYTASPIYIVGTYFDKVYITPDANAPEVTFISSFFLRIENYTAEFPGEHEKCKIYLNVFDIMDGVTEGDRVVVRMNVKSAWYGDDLIYNKEEIFRIDAEGRVCNEDGSIGMDLIETDTLTADTGESVYYNFNIHDRLHISKSVTKGLLQANFKDLPTVTVE
jgi:hypothetical protein